MWGAIAGGLLGSLAGGQRDTSNTSSNSYSSVDLRDSAALDKGRSGVETAGSNASMDQFNQLLALTNAGPGAEAVSQGFQASNSYADMLNNVLQSGGRANQNQIDASNQYASQIFAPQQTALNQQFNDQRIQASRMAAKLGRPGNDPILANKLAQEQTRQQSMLNSQQGAFGAQYADSMVGRQLDLGSSLMNVRQGLATQAMNNRTTLMGLGQQLVNSERNYRLQTAGRSNSSNGTQSSGGGLAGAISGGLAGFGTGAATFGNAGPSFSSMFSSSGTNAASAGMGGGAASSPMGGMSGMNRMMSDPTGNSGQGRGEGMY